jgi:hypothetical protein
MKKNKAIENLEKTDISDPRLIEKILDYLFIVKSDSFPENPVENSLHMNDSEKIFVHINNMWQEIDFIKNTEDFPGWEEDAGIIQ